MVCLIPGACCCKFVIFIKRKKSRLDRIKTDTNEEFFSTKYYPVHEDHDFNYNLISNLNEEVCFQHIFTFWENCAANFKETCNIREVSLLGKAYPNCQYFNVADHSLREESQLVQGGDEPTLKMNVQNNNLKLKPRMGTLVRYRYFIYNNSN